MLSGPPAVCDAGQEVAGVAPDEGVDAGPDEAAGPDLSGVVGADYLAVGSSELHDHLARVAFPWACGHSIHGHTIHRNRVHGIVDEVAQNGQENGVIASAEHPAVGMQPHLNTALGGHGHLRQQEGRHHRRADPGAHIVGH